MPASWYSPHFPVHIRMPSPKEWRGGKSTSFRHGAYRIFRLIPRMWEGDTIPTSSASTASPERAASTTSSNRASASACRRRCARRWDIWSRMCPTKRIKSSHRISYTGSLKITTSMRSRYLPLMNATLNRRTALSPRRPSTITITASRSPASETDVWMR